MGFDKCMLGYRGTLTTIQTMSVAINQVPDF
jgi:hypothetical protein